MSEAKDAKGHYLWLSGFFTVIAVVHLVRAGCGLEVTIQNFSIPLHWSWIVGGVAALLALGCGWRGMGKRLDYPDLP